MALKEFKEILKKLIQLREIEKEKIHMSSDDMWKSRWTKLMKVGGQN